MVYDATIPGTEVASGTTYGSIAPGTASQSGAYFVRYDGASGTATAPALIDAQSLGHQVFPAISADGGVLHALWWDSRNDPNYSPKRPIGNDTAGNVGASLEVFAAKSTDGGNHVDHRSGDHDCQHEPQLRTILQSHRAVRR